MRLGFKPSEGEIRVFLEEADAGLEVHPKVLRFDETSWNSEQEVSVAVTPAFVAPDAVVSPCHLRETDKESANTD